MAKFLVTGGAGFIGSNIAEALLARGDEVRILDNLSTGHKHNLDVLDVELGDGEITTPDDVRHILAHTEAVGFVGASSLERMGVEESLTNVTKEFKSIELT